MCNVLVYFFCIEILSDVLFLRNNLFNLRFIIIEVLSKHAVISGMLSFSFSLMCYYHLKPPPPPPPPHTLRPTHPAGLASSTCQKEEEQEEEEKEEEQSEEEEVHGEDRGLRGHRDPAGRQPK